MVTGIGASVGGIDVGVGVTGVGVDVGGSGDAVGVSGIDVGCTDAGAGISGEEAGDGLGPHPLRAIDSTAVKRNKPDMFFMFPPISRLMLLPAISRPRRSAGGSDSL
jgi:hypothetical protein